MHQQINPRRRQAIALVFAFVAFAFAIWGFEGTAAWPHSIPIVTLPLYTFMQASPWNYGAVELGVGLLLAFLVRKWVLWWFRAMDADQSAWSWQPRGSRR